MYIKQVGDVGDVLLQEVWNRSRWRKRRERDEQVEGERRRKGKELVHL